MALCSILLSMHYLFEMLAPTLFILPSIINHLPTVLAALVLPIPIPMIGIARVITVFIIVVESIQAQQLLALQPLIPSMAPPLSPTI